jgi:hypothetical protein
MQGQEGVAMARDRHILALGFGEEFDALADRLPVLSFRATHASTTEDGVRALERSGEPIRAVLLAIPHTLGELSVALGRLRDHATTSHLRFVAAGPQPGPRELEEIRRAGVEFALWKPFDDAALRFVLNEALQDPRSGKSRNLPRAPTRMLARVYSSTGQKAAQVYNLSEGGAFLETARPTSAKGHVSVELPLPTGTVTLKARVVTTNVPGNIQKANLPMGMGVEFIDVSEETGRALAKYVEALAELHRVDEPDPV